MKFLESSAGQPKPDTALAKGYVPAGDAEQVIAWLQERVRHLERQLDWKQIEYIKLKNLYDGLADQWNAFQATARPDSRNVHRAEAAGELARKLAEVLIGLSYDKDIQQPLLEVLDGLAQLNRAKTNAPRQETGPKALPAGAVEIDP
jgi:hypothetical protein